MLTSLTYLLLTTYLLDCGDQVDPVGAGARAGAGGAGVGAGVCVCADEINSFVEDIRSARDILVTTIQTSYMQWTKGSKLIFWRWHPDQQRVARDGFTPCMINHLPKHLAQPQKNQGSY